MTAGLIDQIISLASDELEAAKVFPADDPVFLDHFPGLPIVPGSLLTQLMAEAGGWLLFSRSDFQVWPRLERLERVKFRRVIEPGQDLRINVQRHSCDGSRWVLKARIFRLSEQAAEGFLLFCPAGFPLSPTAEWRPPSHLLLNQLRSLKAASRSIGQGY